MGLISRVSSRTYRGWSLIMTTYIRKNEDTGAIDSTGALIQIRNPETGKFEWKLTEPEHDFSTELSISHYCDMLHDIERNELYRKAIEKTVKHMLDNGESVDVLDIGTGTG